MNSLYRRLVLEAVAAANGERVSRSVLRAEAQRLADQRGHSHVEGRGHPGSVRLADAIRKLAKSGRIGADESHVWAVDWTPRDVCSTKLRFAELGAAIGGLLGAQADGVKVRSVYSCESCSGWHMTKKPPTDGLVRRTRRTVRRGA